MSINFSNGLVGLSLLTGSNAVATFANSAIQIETRAARTARLQFTTPATTPPWKEPLPNTPVSSQVAAIKRMTTIIDKASPSDKTDQDVQNMFAAYKALDRMRLLADTAAKKTTSSAERTALNKAFTKGMTDLQTFLATSTSDKVQLAFAQPTRRVDTVSVPSAGAGSTLGKGVLEERNTPVPGLTGSETFTIKLSRGTINNTVTLDLSGTPQPPTLDSVAQALNDKIATIPMTDTNGDPVMDANGNPVSRWSTKFVVTKESGRWGLKLETPGYEHVSIDQSNAGDAIMVASGQTATGSPTATKITRFDDPAGGLEIHTLNTLQSLDRLATEAAKLAETKDKPAKNVFASTTTSAIATDADGFSYVVGTTSGDMGANRLAGTADLYLTKLDSEGKVVWQQTLGSSANATGAAVSIAPNGDIVVAGTVTGPFKGATTDGDMMVSRFSANGDEQFSSVVRSFGADTATSVAVAEDGTLYVAGKGATGSGDAVIARLSATGVVQERRTIDSGGSDSVKALAIGADGELLALTNENGTAKLHKFAAGSLATETGSLDLGARDARVIAVSSDGQIAVGGAVAGDGFVTRIDADLTTQATTMLATTENDQVDSLSFLGDDIYAGGRTTGELGGPRIGSVDGFVARIGATDGAVESVKQFGSATTEPVKVAAVKGGDSALGALGLNRGNINPDVSQELASNTSLRAGDEFQLRVNDGPLRKITIAEGETLATLSKKISAITGKKALVTTPLDGKGGRTLRIQAVAGQEIDLVPGAEGKNALPKLGLAPSRISTPAPVADDAPKVRPGGSFGLGLTFADNLLTTASATEALKRLEAAISVSQTAYRSLYWDASKEAMANGTTGKGTGNVSAYQAAQAGRYQAALDRLTGPTTFTGF